MQSPATPTGEVQGPESLVSTMFCNDSGHTEISTSGLRSQRFEVLVQRVVAGRKVLGCVASACTGAPSRCRVYRAILISMMPGASVQKTESWRSLWTEPYRAFCLTMLDLLMLEALSGEGLVPRSEYHMHCLCIACDGAWHHSCSAVAGRSRWCPSVQVWDDA